MNRLLVASRTRPDIDLRECLGSYEFTVTPPSLFSPDGTLHPTKDKSVIAEELFQLQTDHSNTNEYECAGDNIDDAQYQSDEIRKVVIVDGMAIVNRVDIKKKEIRNCADFAKCFNDIIDRETAEYHEVRVIFDRYKSNSLKTNTRTTRTKRMLFNSLQSF